MTALFYQIINNIEKITHKNYKDFKKKLIVLLEWFKEANDIDNIKVLRNKLESLLQIQNPNSAEPVKFLKKIIKDYNHITGAVV